MALELPGWNISQYTIYYTTVPGIPGRSADEHEFPGDTTSGIVPISGVTPNQTHQFQVSGSLDIEGEIYKGPRSENRSIIISKYLAKLFSKYIKLVRKRGSKFLGIEWFLE